MIIDNATLEKLSSTSNLEQKNNTISLGNILYTDFALLFQMCGIILLVAMIGAIVLTLRKRTDVQNIDLMNLAGFCRKCLSGWYQDAANEKDIPLSKEEARAIIYGMPYSEWKKNYQTENEI